MEFKSEFTMTIDGKAARSAETFKVINPATEEVIAEVPDISREQLDETIAEARKAFPRWKATPLTKRQAAVTAIGERLAEREEDFARLLTTEQGKPLADARREVSLAADWLRAVARQEPAIEVVADTPERLIETRHVPIGVVCALVPWNFPLLLAAFKIAPALVTGNALILKPSPFTPLTSLKLGELTRNLLPPGVFNIISGGDRLGPWMTEHPGIDKVSFTGSTATGRAIMRSASVNVKRITLELGGNDPAIVLKDANVEKSIPKLFWSAFMNNGQMCIASKRIYVHESIYERFAHGMVEYAKTVRMGNGAEDGVQLGPVQNKSQYDRLCKLLSECKSAGISFLLGGEVPHTGKGYFIPIAIADNPGDASRLVTEEAFGPVRPLLRYSTTEEVVRRANDSIYGLAASVWGTDLDGAQKVADQIEAGTVWINTGQELLPTHVFGGQKQSGLGVENGVAGLLEYTNPQTLVRNKVALEAVHI
ncbi:MAG TPA: aldehyde dehydrogenase family protein [Nitrospirales bacterium]